MAAPLDSATVVCLGASMEPTVRVGQAVDVQMGAAVRAALAPGDVMLFRSAGGEREILHRLVARLPLTPYYVHQGDASGASPGLVHARSVLGRARLAPRPPSRATQLRRTVRALLSHARGRLRSRPPSN